MTLSTTKTTPAIKSEEQRIEEWRIKQFKLYGFSEQQIALLLMCNVDHHDASRLLGAGCTFDAAVALLT